MGASGAAVTPNAAPAAAKRMEFAKKKSGDSSAGLAERKVLVVFCTVSPEAAQERSFEKLLAENGMVWRSRPSRRSAGKGGVRQELALPQAEQQKADAKPSKPTQSEEARRNND